MIEPCCMLTSTVVHVTIIWLLLICSIQWARRKVACVISMQVQQVKRATMSGWSEHWRSCSGQGPVLGLARLDSERGKSKTPRIQSGIFCKNNVPRIPVKPFLQVSTWYLEIRLSGDALHCVWTSFWLRELVLYPMIPTVQSKIN